jgi:hypothetical protein
MSLSRLCTATILHSCLRPHLHYLLFAAVNSAALLFLNVHYNLLIVILYIQQALCRTLNVTAALNTLLAEFIMLFATTINTTNANLVFVEYL